MATSLVLICALLVAILTTGSSHVGGPCNAIFKLCLVTNSYCDADRICRCKPEYPVNVSPHSCKRGRRYGEQCKFPEECRYYDPNSYCTQLPYSSVCDCYTGYTYSEAKQICVEIVTEKTRSPNLILPTAIGLSLAFASILCCCMVLWHICKRQNFHNWGLTSPTLSQNSSTENNPVEGTNTFLNTEESLPNYDVALNLKRPEDDCELPPSYEEVIRGTDYAATKV